MNEKSKIVDKDIKDLLKEKEVNQIQGNKTEKEQKKEDEPKNESKPKKVEEPKKDVKKENEKEKENIEQNNKKNLKEENIITKDIKPRGLNNIGSTCYMNSVIQCLYHIFDLSNELMKLYKKNILNDTLLKKLPMTYEFLDVIFDLSFGKKNSISPYQFKKII